MPAISENNKRIAKNTLYLYLRMLLLLFVGLFTSRVTLNALGVHDFGLLSVVGGVLGFLGYFSGLLGQGTSRFLTVGLGKGDINELKNIFSACSAIHIVFALLTLVAGETVGLWFVNNKLVIDAERMFAANWVYQLSLMNALLSIIQAPFMATIISHEKMPTFAFMSIYDVVMKMLVVCLLLYIDTDKLILYSTFYSGVSLTTFLIYRIYCLRHFEECNLRLKWDVKLYKEIWNYVGWNSIGSFAFMANMQGITILLNMFFSTTVNAARGIAFTVSAHVNNFVANFQTAVRPQVMKNFAQGDYPAMNRLICNNAKYSSYLLILIGLPVAVETPFLIDLWLGQVPEFVVVFIRLTLLQMLFQGIDFPVGDGIHAFGRMKLPNITSSIAYLSVLPITYIALKLGASPVVAYIVSILTFPVALGCDLWILNKYSGFNIKYYLKKVPATSFFILIISAIPILYIHSLLEESWLRLVVVTGTSVFTSGVAIMYIGLNKEMRAKIVHKLKVMTK